MPAAITHGKGGKVEFTDTEFTTITNWTLNVTIDTADSTAMAAANWGKTILAGFKDWTATVECVANEADFQVAEGNDYELEFYYGQLAAEGLYTGFAICTGCTATVDMNDVGRYTYTFEGSNSDGNGLTWAELDP